MFTPGLETNITKLSKSKYKIIVMALLNGLVPFGVGLAITRIFGYSWTVSLLIGIVFISSSVAVIVSSLKENKSISRDVEQLILSAVMVADITSLVALGFIFESASRLTHLPLPLYFIVIVASIFVLFRIVPAISKNCCKNGFLPMKGTKGS